ncbi:MAG TPA: hypothetical protein VFF73_09910 [Planctomycetota bacterium]|nr:hypothetical protein [Planctomycetota bacterium]
MAYRYNARGTLVVSERHIEKVVNILDNNDIQYKRRGNIIKIEHDERAAVPSSRKADECFRDLAPYIDEPQAISIWSELQGESEVGFVDGMVRTDEVENVWAADGDVPTPDEVCEELRRRGIAAAIARPNGARKSGRRARVFEIQPGSGGPGCKLTVKRRFWDSFDLLSVPEVYQGLCEKYHLSPLNLRERLHGAKFGIEVRNPALGGASSDMLYENILAILEERCDGIRTEIG